MTSPYMNGARTPAHVFRKCPIASALKIMKNAITLQVITRNAVSPH